MTHMDPGDGLKWTAIDDIAAALAHTHPDADPAQLDNEDVIAMVRRLPDFADTPRPDDPESMYQVLYAWIKNF